MRWTTRAWGLLLLVAAALGAKPRTAAEWWALPAVPLMAVFSRNGPLKRTHGWSRYNEWSPPKAPTPITRKGHAASTTEACGLFDGHTHPPSLDGKRRKTEDGLTINRARVLGTGNGASVRVKATRLKLLPKQMLFLLAHRIRLEEFRVSSAVCINERYRQILIDEKLFPEETNLFRAQAEADLKALHLEAKEAGGELFAEIIPKHLHDVLQQGERRRAVTAVHKLIQKIDWPDKNLPTEIAMGFQAENIYLHGQGLEESALAAEALANKPSWEEFLNTPPDLHKLGKQPTAWPESVLKMLEDEVDAMIEKKMILPRHAHEIRYRPGRIFPKVEEKIDGTKARVLSDERFRNLHLQCHYKARLVGSRQHVELLTAALAPAGEEDSRRIPTSQSSRELWLQCQRELHRTETEGIAASTLDQPWWNSESSRLCKKIREAMTWVNRRSILKRKAREWESTCDAVCTAHSPQRDSSPLLCGLPTGASDDAPGEEVLGGLTGVYPSMGTRDFKGAYYQVGIADPETSPIAWWSVREQEWKFGASAVLNMGGHFSVPSWVRLANFVVACAASLGRVVAPCYIDDTALISNSKTYNSADSFFQQLCETLGLNMSHKKEANQRSDEGEGRVRLLGLNYQWIHDPRNKSKVTIKVTVPQPTVDKTISAAVQILKGLAKNRKKDKVTTKMIQQVVGGGNFCACAAGTRAGAELLRPLYAWLQDAYFDAHIGTETGRTNLRHAVKGLLVLLNNPKPIFIEQNDSREMYVMATDASGRDAETDGSISEPWLGALLIDPQGVVHVTKRSAAPEPLEDSIAVLESKAVQMGFAVWGDKLRGKDVLVYLDNQHSAFSFVELGCKNPRVTKVAVDVATWAYNNNCTTFWQYINTDYNPADSLTRENWRDLCEDMPESAQYTPYGTAVEDAASLQADIRKTDVGAKGRWISQKIDAQERKARDRAAGGENEGR